MHPPTIAAYVKHSDWDSVRVFLGPNAMQQAEDFIRQSIKDGGFEGDLTEELLFEYMDDETNGYDWEIGTAVLDDTAEELVIESNGNEEPDVDDDPAKHESWDENGPTQL